MKIIFITLILFLNSFAQVKIISQKIIPLPKTENWHKPIFSKNGNALYFTNDSFGGIWKYDLTKNKLNKISGDAGSGYQFSISEDEKIFLIALQIILETKEFKNHFNRFK